ncbi:MAG: hypothetical protein OEZ32_05075 [Nitrospinota bacterium]|nr:hypothetical protein [Nitrospinota bacterium]
MRPPRISVILCQTRHAGNIGAVARLMKNLGLARLTLVRPTARGHLEAIRMAVGAAEIIERARITDSLEEAIEGAGRAWAVTRRPRSIGKTTMAPEDVAAHIAAAPEMETAIVFGSEKLGLSTSQVRLCDAIVTIPTSPAAPSLNLAQAAAIVLSICTSGGGEGEDLAQEEPSTLAERRILYKRIERTLAASGYFRTEGGQKTMADIEDLFSRAAVNRRDCGLLLGMFRRIQAAVER